MLQQEWDKSMKDFKTNVSTKMTGFITPQNAKIEEQLNRIADDELFKRLNAITYLRTEHQKFVQTIENTFKKEEKDAKGKTTNVRDDTLTFMEAAYTTFVNSIHVLDYSKEG